MRYCFTAFTQLDFTTRVASLTLPPSAAFSRSQLTFQAGGLLLTWESQAENCVGFCSEAAQIPKCIWPQSLGLPRCSSQCILLISRISPHFQHLSSSQDLKCLLSGKASSSRIHPGSYSPSSIHPFSPCPNFPNLNRLCGEVQCPISLIMVNSVPRLFI